MGGGAVTYETDLANAAGRKVYERLLAQGRTELEARHDAERWVKGNLGMDIRIDTVPTTGPVGLPRYVDAPRASGLTPDQVRAIYRKLGVL